MIRSYTLFSPAILHQTIRSIPTNMNNPLLQNNVRWLSTLKHTASSKSFKACHLSSFIGNQLLESLNRSKSTYLLLQKISNQQKIEIVLQQFIRNAIASLGLQNKNISLHENWNYLRDILQQQSIEFPNYNENNISENALILFRLFSKSLVLDSHLTTKFQNKDFIETPSDFYWSSVTPTIPFTRLEKDVKLDLPKISYILAQLNHDLPVREGVEKEIADWIYFSSSEDCLAALLMTTPYLNDDTLINEVGCWNGENLFNLLYHSFLLKKSVAGIIGTDINTLALNIAETVGTLIGLGPPSANFYLANAVNPISLKSTGVRYKREVRIALKVVPVLHPKSIKRFLLAANQSLKSKDSVLILSYAVPKGAMFDKNKLRVGSRTDENGSFMEESFSGGIYFKTTFPSPELLPSYLKNGRENNIILNTYFTPKSFNELTAECGFKTLQSVFIGEYSDNDRVVVALSRS